MGILKHNRNEVKAPEVKQVKEAKKTPKPTTKEGEK
jgi:hypothetical protein